MTALTPVDNAARDVTATSNAGLFHLPESPVLPPKIGNQADGCIQMRSNNNLLGSILMRDTLAFDRSQKDYFYQLKPSNAAGELSRPPQRRA